MNSRTYTSKTETDLRPEYYLPNDEVRRKSLYNSVDLTCTSFSKNKTDWVWPHPLLFPGLLLTDSR